MPRLTGAEAIVHTVMNHGVDTIFGLPGGQLYYLYDAFYKNRDRLKLITSRHEQGAAYMALGYAHSTGKVGVYDVVPGPGRFVLEAEPADGPLAHELHRILRQHGRQERGQRLGVGVERVPAAVAEGLQGRAPAGHGQIAGRTVCLGE